MRQFQATAKLVDYLSREPPNPVLVILAELGGAQLLKMVKVEMALEWGVKRIEKMVSEIISGCKAMNSSILPTPEMFSARGSYRCKNGREDAHLYFAGELNTASGTPFSGSVDLKVELPLPALRSFRFGLVVKAKIK